MLAEFGHKSESRWLLLVRTGLSRAPGRPQQCKREQAETRESLRTRFRTGFPSYLPQATEQSKPQIQGAERPNATSLVGKTATSPSNCGHGKARRIEATYMASLYRRFVGGSKKTRGCSRKTWSCRISREGITGQAWGLLASAPPVGAFPGAPGCCWGCPQDPSCMGT